jgi:hypothetical protein
MTNDIVQRLRARGQQLFGLCAEAADMIEAQAKEIERLTLNGIHTCHGQCQRPLCVQGREIRRLREALEDISKRMDCGGDPDVAHYCPNCDNSMFHARLIARNALQEGEG